MNVLLDFSIIDNSLTRIREKVSPIPTSTCGGYKIGLVLRISNSSFDALTSIEEGDRKLEYINSNLFIQSIKYHSFILYSRSKKRCFMLPLSKDVNMLKHTPKTSGKEDTDSPQEGYYRLNMGEKSLKSRILQVTNCLLYSLPSDITLLAMIPFDDVSSISKLYASHGFSTPVILDGKNLCIRGKYLALQRINTIIPRSIDISTVLADVKHTMTTLGKNPLCFSRVEINKKDANIIKSLYKIGNTLNKSGDVSQKEIAGRLYIDGINKKGIYVLKIDTSSMISGGEEEVSCLKGNFTFHTHPISAYIANKINVGWPSGQDFSVFFRSLYIGSSMHFVFSKEGIYSISPTSELLLSLKYINANQAAEFIMKNYHHWKSNMTIAQFITTVNAVLYRGIRLFNVQYMPYSKIKPLTVISSKKDSNCFNRILRS
jgi:hypothetical protein